MSTTPQTQSRILLVATQSGTLYTFVLPLANFLTELGHDVTLACSGDPQPDVPSYHETIEDAGFEVVRLDLARHIDPRRDRSAVRQLRALIRDLEVDVVHTYNSKAGVVGRLAAWREHVPCIVHTNLGLPFFKASLFSPLQSLTYLTVELLVAKITDRILCISKAEFDKAVRFRIARPPRLVDVGFGARFDVFDPAREDIDMHTGEVARLRRLTDGGFVVGCVARLVREKGVDCLIEATAEAAAQLHQPLHVVVVGDGPERAALERQVSEMGTRAQVHFAGAIAEPRVVAAMYRLFDIFVLPTRWESFGVVFAEAMAMEIPVVGPDMEPIRTVIGQGPTGVLVTPDDPGEYAAAIVRLVRDPELRRRTGLAGADRSREHWDERNVHARVYHAYRDVLDSLKG
ncbi:MAG: glycosyltransferase family 4 protein [Gemmatimonadota bacterium]|nr:glycosyltransferase family 4 protein [Gemmatimonadota bacterium]